MPSIRGHHSKIHSPSYCYRVSNASCLTLNNEGVHLCCSDLSCLKRLFLKSIGVLLLLVWKLWIVLVCHLGPFWCMLELLSVSHVSLRITIVALYSLLGSSKWNLLQRPQSIDSWNSHHDLLVGVNGYSFLFYVLVNEALEVFWSSDKTKVHMEASTSFVAWSSFLVLGTFVIFAMSHAWHLKSGCMLPILSIPLVNLDADLSFCNPICPRCWCHISVFIIVPLWCASSLHCGAGLGFDGGTNIWFPGGSSNYVCLVCCSVSQSVALIAGWLDVLVPLLPKPLLAQSACVNISVVVVISVSLICLNMICVMQSPLLTMNYVFPWLNSITLISLR